MSRTPTQKHQPTNLFNPKKKASLQKSTHTLMNNYGEKAFKWKNCGWPIYFCIWMWIPYKLNISVLPRRWGVRKSATPRPPLSLNPPLSRLIPFSGKLILNKKRSHAFISAPREFFNLSSRKLNHDPVSFDLIHSLPGLSEIKDLPEFIPTSSSFEWIELSFN